MAKNNWRTDWRRTGADLRKKVRQFQWLILPSQLKLALGRMAQLAQTCASPLPLHAGGIAAADRGWPFVISLLAAGCIKEKLQLNKKTT